MTKHRGRRFYTGGQTVPGVRFQGEVMHCVMCPKEQKSDPKVESQWTAIQVETDYYYVCPDHIPVNGTQADYAAAYRKILSKIAELRGGKI